MIPYRVEDICKAVGGELLQSSDAKITSFCIDSRKVGQGDLFLPFVGERVDGHKYIDGALSAGAAGCFTQVVPEKMQSGKFYIKVEDTMLALKKLAMWYREPYTIPFVQITGSAGKTTTKEMIAYVLGRHFKTMKTFGNLNSPIGTPLTLLNLEPDTEAAVIETGMNHFGEILYMGEMVRPDFAVISNVGDAHIENLGGTRQGTLKAKSEIFEYLKPDGIAVLNGDDELLSKVTLQQRIILCGKGENCDVRVSNIRDLGIEGIDCLVTTQKDTYEIHIPSPGQYMIYPVSMAVAIAECLGLSKEEIIAGVGDYVPTGSRMHLIRDDQSRLIIDDCYNANPQAMAEALRVLSDTRCARHVAVLGDMGELGDLGEQAHRGIGKLVNTLKIDKVIAIGTLARFIAEEVQGDVSHFATIEEAKQELKAQYAENTAVLVKASHSMEFEKIVEFLND